LRVAFFIAGGYHNVCASASQAERDAAPDSAVPTGDQGYLPGKVEFVQSNHPR
jgi:hypothetical protein